MFCLLQKVERCSNLPVIEKWEAYILPNHSCFGAIAEEHFLEGIRLLSSLEKKIVASSGKSSAKTRRLLEDVVSTFFSTVAARSPVWHGLSCFCPKIIIGGDDYSAFHLSGQLLDGLLELGWVRESEIEPAKVEFHTLIRKQRQVETSGKTFRVPTNSVFAFCDQRGFRSRRIFAQS